jgi:ATP-dependent Clp protease ATP-binding subunit ClpC
MLERFTLRGRRVVVLAQDEARLLNHDHVGTGHLLLGLLREGEGAAAGALADGGIGLAAARREVREIAGRDQQTPDVIPFTVRAERVLGLSGQEADALGHRYISSEHVLLGVLREGAGGAVQALTGLGADLNRLRGQVLQQLRGRPGPDLADESSRPGDEVLAPVGSPSDHRAAIERWAGIRPDLDDLADQIAQLSREKEAAVDRQEFETAAALRVKEKELIERLARMRATVREDGIKPGDDATA